MSDVISVWGAGPDPDEEAALDPTAILGMLDAGEVTRADLTPQQTRIVDEWLAQLSKKSPPL